MSLGSYKVCRVVLYLGNRQNRVSAHYLYGFSPSHDDGHSWWCQEDVPSACVACDIELVGREGSQVALPEHTQEPKGEADFHGWSRRAQAGQELAKLGEEVH